MARRTPHSPLPVRCERGRWLGRVRWQLAGVYRCERLPASFVGVGYDCCRQAWGAPGLPKPTNPPDHVAVDVDLSFLGPFLVNDASRSKDDVHPERTNFIALARADGSAWLPGSSFRGAPRQHSERVLRTLDPGASGDPNATASAGPNPQLPRVP